MKTDWLDRSLITGPYIILVLSEKQFHKAMKHCHIKKGDCGDWIKSSHANATVHFLEKADGKLCCIVAIKAGKNIATAQINAMIVHEAVHVWQRFKQRIGEDHPSDEFEAYAIQAISQRLMESYANRNKKK